jgi:haloacetate dehalogenase
MFDGFTQAEITTPGATITALHGGVGPPLLLLHGYPQTHVMWHKVAPLLARDFTIVATDLRGYGDSSKPENGPDHAGYSKRAMAQDQVEVMAQLGFETFFVAGHDRGGRVAHRMALDHRERVKKLAVLDIVPTRRLYADSTREFATAYFWWFFLIQPAPLPETLIGNSVEFWLSEKLGKAALGAITSAAFAEYLRCYRDPEMIHASCEDYRAAASIDLAHDEADIDRMVECPLLALWGEHAPMHRLYDVAATWRERATNVTGTSLPGTHYFVEEIPELVAAEFKTFFLARPT